MSGDDRDLTEAEIEALAHGRNDLATDHARDLAERDPETRARVERERAASHETSLALRRALPDLDGVDTLVAGAMSKFQEPAAAARERDAPAPSRLSLLIGAALGASIVTASSAASLLGPSGVGGPGEALADRWSALRGLARIGWTLASMCDRAVSELPFGWTAVAIGSLALAVLFLVPLRVLAGSWRTPGAVAILLSLSLASTRASAWELEGQWPETEMRVSADVDRVPLSEALRVALASSELGLVYAAAIDPTVSLHVRDVALRDVLDSVLVDVPVRVRLRGQVLTVRAIADDTGAAAASSSPPIAVAITPAVAPPPQSGQLFDGDMRDVVIFGGDAHVAPGQDVRDVVAMGGDARVEGHAIGDVVAFGGDADVSGTVVGDVIAFGGNVRVARGGHVHGELQSFGGEVSIEDPPASATAAAVVSRSEGAHGEPARGGETSWLQATLDSALRHALLFLLGLLVMGLAPERWSALQAQLVRKPLHSFGAGVLAILAGGALMLVLIVSCIGAPAGLALGLLLFFAGSIGLAIGGSVIGAALPIAAIQHRPVAQLGVGLTALFVASLVPGIGAVIFAGALVVGMGAVVTTRFGQRREG